jgi:DNA-binding transcriptional LysR family regulator
VYTLVQLTQFVAVAEEMHFGRAAERLHMTQPPLSRQMQLLEKDLHVLLFDRSSRAIKLTRAGRAFYADARRLLQQADRAALSVRKAWAGQSGVLRVGFTGGSVHSGLAAVLKASRREIPDVELDLRELVTMAQLEALSNGVLDIALIRPPVTRPDLLSRNLIRERLIIAMPKNHALAQQETVEVAQLDGIDLIMFNPIESRYFFELVSAVLHAASVAPVMVQYMVQIHSILAVVNLDWGVALVPESASKMEFENVEYRRLKLALPAEVELDLVWRASDENPVLDRLLPALGLD